MTTASPLTDGARLRRRRVESRFWLGSLLVHGVILLVILRLPVGEVFIDQQQAGKPEVIRQGEELNEVIEEVRDVAADRLRAQIALLEAGGERMAGNFQTLNSFHQPFVSQQRATVRARLEQQVGELFRLQEALLAAMERAAKEGEGASDPMWRAYDTRRVAILVGQEELRRAVRLLAGEDAELLALQTAAEQAQTEADQALQRSVSCQNNLWGNAKQLQDLETQIPALSARVEEQKAAVTVAEAELPLAEQAVAAAQQAGSGQKPADDALKGIRRRIQRANEQLQKDGKRLTELVADRERRSGATPELIVRRDAEATAAAALQREVLQTQREVHRRLLEILTAQEAEAAAAEAAVR
jgi:hypothetical protein